MAHQGTVKSFREDKGFGFIIRPDNTEVFVHVKAIMDGSILMKDDIVQFDLEESRVKPGQMQAVNVSGGTGQPGGGKGSGKPGSQMGTVKNFREDKGFGFITLPDGSDLFMHIKSCVDGGIPQPGDTVRFDVEENRLKPGQMQACNVSGGSGQKGAGKGGFGNFGPGGGKGKGGPSPYATMGMGAMGMYGMGMPGMPMQGMPGMGAMGMQGMGPEAINYMAAQGMGPMPGMGGGMY
mmetsp:Transcript_57824/g.108354  ORF Transcript_57824/g.108354 Transcript_57824/m.108354 type:complete len:236 (+) Transcript_57824:70-777(+)